MTARSKSRRRGRVAGPVRLAVVFGAALVLFVVVIWYLADRRSEPVSATSSVPDFGTRLIEIATARGAQAAGIRPDDPIRKVDGVFVRSWWVDLPDAAAVQTFVADVESEASLRGLAVVRPNGSQPPNVRLRIELGVEAFDLRVGLAKPRVVEIPATPTPLPEPTVAPTATPRPALPTDARGRLAILLDDAGQSMDLVPEAEALPANVAIAVLPFLPYSADTANRMYGTGHEIWLHLPMEATGEENPGPGAVMVGMESDEVRTTIQSALNNVPHVVGVNNHMGSKASADLRTMTWVMQELSSRGMAFLDSRTSIRTVAEDAARAQGVATGRRHVFLDNRRERAAILAQLDEAIYRARADGDAVAIGHFNKVMVDVLKAECPGLSERGVDLVPPSQLMK